MTHTIRIVSAALTLCVRREREMKRLALALFPLLLLAQTDTEKLQRIFDEEHAEFLREYPQAATGRYGRQPGPGRWNDQSRQAIDRRREQSRARLAALRALNPDALSRADRFNYDLLVNRLQQRLDFAAFPSGLLALTNRFLSPAFYLPQSLTRVPAETIADYEKILDLLRGIPDHLNQKTELLQRGVQEGVVMPDVAVRAVPSQLDTLTALNQPAVLCLRPFAAFLRASPPPNRIVSPRKRMPSSTHRSSRRCGGFAPMSPSNTCRGPQRT